VAYPQRTSHFNWMATTTEGDENVATQVGVQVP
jgi:hypothetical protein